MQLFLRILQQIRRHSLLYIGVVVAVVLVMLYAFDPSQQVLAPKCVFRSLTGWSCPGCGFQRAVHALLHGHVLAAVRFNPFLLLCIPYVVLLAVAEWCLGAVRRSRWQHVLCGRKCVYLYLIAYVAWGVVRNVIGM